MEQFAQQSPHHILSLPLLPLSPVVLFGWSKRKPVVVLSCTSQQHERTGREWGGTAGSISAAAAGGGAPHDHSWFSVVPGMTKTT